MSLSNSSTIYYLTFNSKHPTIGSQNFENIGDYASHRFSVVTIDEGVAVPDLEVEKRTIIVLKPT